MAYKFTATEFANKRKTVIEHILDENGLFKETSDNILAEFESDGLTSVELAQIKMQFYATTYIELEKHSSEIVFKLMEQEITAGASEQDELLIKEKINLVKRETVGFNDNLLVKKAEFRGQVAAMAINSDSYDASNVVQQFTAAIADMVER